MKKLLLTTLVIFIIVSALLMIERSVRLHRTPKQSTQGENAQQVLPSDAELKNVITQEVVKLEKFANKVVLVNFWASWCEACIEEMPSIIELHKKLKDEGFEVISVNLDENPQKVVPRVMDQMDFSFPVYLSVAGRLPIEYEISGIPYNIIAGKNLKIIWAESGERDWSSQEIISEIRKLLK